MAQLEMAPAAPPGDCSRYVGFSSIGLFSNTPPLIVLGVDCCVGALQRESRSSNLSHDQALSTSSRSSLLALKKGILFGGTSTRAPVFGLRPVRPPRWRVLKVPNPRISTLFAGSQCTDDAVQYRADDDVSLLQGQPNDLVNLLGQFGPRQPRQSPLHQQQRIPRGISCPETRHGVASGTRGSASLLQPDLIVDGLPQPLLAAQVSLRGLHRNVAQQELNLLQFAARRMT
jgi:hypothetical protein